MLFEVVPAGKIEMVKLQIDAELASRSVHHAQAFRHDFFANAVSWNHGNAVSGHGGFLLKNAENTDK
jgi:hypothetical protein